MLFSTLHNVTLLMVLMDIIATHVPPNLHSMSTNWLTVKDCPAATLDMAAMLDLHCECACMCVCVVRVCE